MTMHTVEFSYLEPGYGTIEMELDDALSEDEKIVQAMKKIDTDPEFTDALDIDIEDIYTSKVI